MDAVMNILIWDDLHPFFSLAEKYDYVGRLLKPGEEPQEYTDAEDADEQSSEADKSKDDWAEPVYCHIKLVQKVPCML